MSLRNLTKDEILQMSLTDVTFELLKEKKGGQEFQKLFREVCEIIGELPEDMKSKIGQFYSALSFDYRFVILADSTWDLRSRHIFDQVNPDYTDFDFDDDIIDEDFDDFEEEEEEVVDAVEPSDDEEFEPEEDLKGLVAIDGDEIL